MAIDLAAIRKKLNQLNGQGGSKIQKWRPEENSETTIRIIAFPNNEGQPFKERDFYYNIGKNPGLLAPRQFGKPDPIQELINKLREEGTKDSYELAKKLYPSTRFYAAVVVRGEEEKGVQTWAFGKKVNMSLLSFMLDEDYGDYTDPLEGRDIRVISNKSPGKQYADTEVRVRGKVTPLAEDENTMKQWLDNVPNIDDMFTLKSYDELENIVNQWLNGDEDDSGQDSYRNQTTQSSTQSVSQGTKEKDYSSLDEAFASLEG